MRIVRILSIFKKLSGLLCWAAVSFGNLNASTPFSPDRLNTFYDLYTADQKKIVDDAFHVTVATNVTPPPGKLGYAPLVITNNTGLDASRLYVVGKGQTLAKTDAYFLQPNLTNGICALVSSATNNSADPTISVTLSQLPSAGTNSYYIYVPQMVSGRFYISVDKPLYMETTVAAGTGYRTINDPSQTTIQDPNYYTIYQDFEFTLDVNYDLYANVTNVDYFSLPLTLGSYTYPSGALYPTLDNLTVVGYPLTSPRSTILTNILNGLTNNDKSSPAQWVNLAVPFYSDPYSAGAPLTYLRILAAKLSIALGSTAVTFQGAAIPQKFFDSNYLQNSVTGPSAGISYRTQLYNYYNTGGHQLQFTIFPASQPTATYTMTSDTSSLVLKLVSTSPSAPPLVTINLNNLTTESLLDGAIGEWVAEIAITPTSTDPWQTEIAKFLSALFSAGILPPATSVVQPMVSNATYFSTYRGSYFSNPSDFSLYGPWYNLYDQTIHPLLIKTNNFGLGYAYDFDDLLDLAGLLHVNIQTAGVLNPYQPYSVLTAGLIDTAIPNPTVDFSPYTLIVSVLPPSSNPIDIIYSTNPSILPGTTYSLGGSPQTILNVCNYFLVRYYTDGTKTEYLTYKVYPKYQLVLPTTTRYSTQDIPLMNGLVFVSGTDGSTFSIDVPNTNPFPSP